MVENQSNSIPENENPELTPKKAGFIKKHYKTLLVAVGAFIAGGLIFMGVATGISNRNIEILKAEHSAKQTELETALSDAEYNYKKEVESAQKKFEDQYNEKIAQITEQKKEEIKAEIRPQTEKELRQSLEFGIRSDLMKTIKEELTNQYSDEVRAELSEALAPEVRSGLEISLLQTVKQELTAKLEPQIRMELTNKYSQDDKEVAGEYIAPTDGTYLISVPEEYIDPTGHTLPHVKIYKDIDTKRDNQFKFDELIMPERKNRQFTVVLKEGQVIDSDTPYSVNKVK